MPLPNTAAAPPSLQSRYSAVAIGLHWTIALAIAAQIGVGWYMGSLEDHSPAQRSLEAIHISSGLTILLLTLARVAWALFRRPPPPIASLAPWERHLAKAVHDLFYVMLFALISVLLEVFMRYSRYVSVLKWLTLSLFAYVATVLVVRVPWGEVAHHLVVPQIQWTRAYMLAIVGLLGTTISPYLFFWQASQEVEEERENPDAKPLKQAPDQAPAEMARIRLDTDVGMAFSNIIALFILLTAAATLHPKGITDIGSAGQAAEALRPLAGEFAFALFALGIVGTGMLALPVLAGSAAVAVGEAFKWRVGLANKPGRAKAFYATIAVATLAGAVLNLTTIDPMKALVWAAVVNGIVAVPVMAMTMIIASRTKVMGQFKLKGYLRVVGWIATAVMGAAVIGLTVL